MTQFSRALFMIEGGKALELVKAHMAEKDRVSREIRELLEPLGVAEYWSSRDDGTAMSVRFNGAAHPDFTKPDKQGGSRPKKGTEWEARFKQQKGYTNASNLIADAFGVPLSLSYGRDGNKGWRSVGYPFNECGFMWIKPESIYVMWMPDVEAEVRKSEAQGFEIAEPARSFRLEFDGCRRILSEEWDSHVAQYKLKLAREKAAAAQPA